MTIEMITNSFLHTVLAIENLIEQDRLECDGLCLVYRGVPQRDFLVLYDKNGPVSFQRVGTQNIFYSSDSINDILAVFDNIEVKTLTINISKRDYEFYKYIWKQLTNEANRRGIDRSKLFLMICTTNIINFDGTKIIATDKKDCPRRKGYLFDIL